MAGGTPPNVDPVKLMSASKNLMTGDLWQFLTNAESRQQRFERLVGYLTRDDLKVSEPHVYPLSEGPAAHRALEDGSYAGKIILKID